MRTERAKELGDSPATGMYGGCSGLTKREYFAGLAMQGILSNRCTYSQTVLADEAVIYADALLNELAK